MCVSTPDRSSSVSQLSLIVYTELQDYIPLRSPLETTFLLHFVRLTVRDYSRGSAFSERIASSTLQGFSRCLRRRPFVRIAFSEKFSRPRGRSWAFDGVSRRWRLDATASIYRNVSWRRSNVERAAKNRHDRTFGWDFSTGDAKKRDITASTGRSSRTTTSASLLLANILPLPAAACSPLLPDTCRCCRVWFASSENNSFSSVSAPTTRGCRGKCVLLEENAF